MAEAAVAAATIAVVADVGQGYEQNQAANNQQRALALEGQEKTVEMQQKQLSNYDIMQKVLDAQTAQATVRGVALSSPSLNAIQRNTLNIGAKNFNNTELEEDINKSNQDIESKNIRDTLHAQLFSDAASAALQGYNIESKMPGKV